MINLIDIERRYHHLEGDFCDITSCISLWGILRKNLRKRSTYISIRRLRNFTPILRQFFTPERNYYCVNESYFFKVPY